LVDVMVGDEDAVGTLFWGVAITAKMGVVKTSPVGCGVDAAGVHETANIIKKRKIIIRFNNLQCQLHSADRKESFSTL